MIKYVILFLVAMSLLPALPFSRQIFAEIVESGSGPISTERTKPASSKMKVITIVVDKIEDGYIYAKDGTQYAIPSSVKIQKHIHSGTKIRIAELVFIKGRLTHVTLK